MKENRFFPSLTSLLAAAVLSAFVVNLLGSSGNVIWHVSELSMLLFAAVCFASNMLILKKSRPNWHIALLNIMLAAVGFAVLVSFNGIPLSDAGFLFSYAVIIIVVLSWRLTMHTVSLPAAGMIFQASILFILLYIWIGSLTVIIASDLLWLVFMCMLCLAGMLSFRISGAVHSRGTFTLSRGILLIAACIILAVVVLVLTVAADPAGDLLLAVFSLCGRFLGYVMDIILMFFVWLDSIFNEPIKYEDQPWESPGYNFNPDEVTEGNPVAALILIAAIAAVLTVVAIIAIIRILKERHTPEKPPLQKNQRRTRISTFSVIKKLFDQLREKLRLWWLLTVHRDTPIGVYVRLTRSCRFSRYSRRKADTPRTFITRLENLCRSVNDISTADALSALANDVDRLSYSTDKGFGKKLGNAGMLYSNTLSVVRRSQLTIRKQTAG